MTRKIFSAISIVLLVAGALAGVKTLQFRKLIADGKSFVPPPECVSSAVVSEDKWQGVLSAIGSIAAVQGVTITPEIAGIIREVAFESGAVVAKGDLLVRLDTRGGGAIAGPGGAGGAGASQPRARAQPPEPEHGIAGGARRRGGYAYPSIPFKSL